MVSTHRSEMTLLSLQRGPSSVFSPSRAQWLPKFTTLTPTEWRGGGADQATWPVCHQAPSHRQRPQCLRPPRELPTASHSSLPACLPRRANMVLSGKLPLCSKKIISNPFSFHYQRLHASPLKVGMLFSRAITGTTKKTF